MSEVVARGKIKVDARRALGKLRDHMLVDPHLYATEIARAAIALGTKRIDVDFDSDDVWIRWQGGALDPARIARLRDHVLAGDTADALHALGIGVVAALGLQPAYIDVHHASTRFRFDADYPQEDGAYPKPAPSTEMGTVVHVRRKLGFETIRRAILGDVPREIGLLLDAASDAPIELAVRGELHSSKRPNVVLRVDLDEPSATRAVLEVLVPSKDIRPSTNFLERGIRLASYAGVPAWDIDSSDVPLRVVIDAARLPTNASRSEVRPDSEIWVRARAHLEHALELAVLALQTGLIDDARVEFVSLEPADRAGALGAIAATVALAFHAGRELPKAADALLDLPLLADAVGKPLTLRAVGRLQPGAGLLAYTNVEPQSEALAPWLGGIPWLRGHPVERAFSGLRIVPSSERIATARAAHERRRRALTHPAAKPELAPSPAYALNETFKVTEGPFAGLEGAVALVRTTGPFRRSASARIFVEQRLLELMPLPAVLLPVDIAIAWPGMILPRFEYDGVERGRNLDRALLFALRLAASAIGQRLEVRDSYIARLAILAWLGATRSLCDVMPSVGALGPLANDAAWPTTEPDRFVSLREIETYVKKTGAICTGARNAGRAPDGRPVLLADDAQAIRPFLPAKAKIVDYQRWLGVPTDNAMRAITDAIAAMPVHLPLDKENILGFIGALPSGLRIHHCGALLADTKRNGPGLVVVEDRAAVPDPERTGLVWHTRLDVRKVQNELRDLVIARCENGELDPKMVKPYLDEWLAHFAHKANPALSTRIESLPTIAAARRRDRAKAQLLSQPPWPKPIFGDRAMEIGDAGGSIAVALPPDAADPYWVAPLLAVLFDGRFVAHHDIGLPALGYVDLRDEGLLVDFASLSNAGTAWIAANVREASVRLVCRLAEAPGFADDAGALRLCATVVRAGVPKSLRDILRRVKWPCVQGTTRPIGLSVRQQFGAEMYPEWIRSGERSPYDNPILHVPPSAVGELRSAIFVALGCEMEDVTAHLARLQQRRSRGAGRPPPRLDGAPSHPKLRATFESLGVTSAEGELEIAAAPDVLCVEDDGARSVSLATSFPVRAIMRSTDLQTALPEVAAAAEKHLLAVAAAIDPAYPPYVVLAIRAAACARVAGPSDSITRACVFPDSHGRMLSVRNLLEQKRIQVTTDPDHLQKGPGPAAVFLAPNERAVLGAVCVIVDVTDKIREERAGAIRRSVAPFERIELPAHVRQACLFTFLVQGDVTGEVGFLAPEHASMRGISVFHSNRPLATIADDEVGWPLVAAVNDDRVTPTPGYDGLSKRDDALRIHMVVRDAAKPHVQSFLAAPESALGVIRLPFPFRPNNVPCLGVFWLEPSWPRAPAVEIVVPGARLSREPILAGRMLPLSGRLFMFGTIYDVERAFEDALVHARQNIGGIASRAKQLPAEYAWDLRLIGAWTDRDPKIELAIPDPDPALLRVANLRAPSLIVPSRPDPVIPPADTAPITQRDSFFEGLTRTIFDAVRPAPAPPVGGDLERAIRAMKLTGDPVSTIVSVRSGRPVRYDTGSQRLLVNTRHPAVLALDNHPARTFHLLTAAVSEINRELDAVTDSEELAILRDLLQD